MEHDGSLDDDFKQNGEDCFKINLKSQYLHLNQSGLSARLTCQNLKTMGIDMNSSKTRIKLDLSIPEHHLAWSVYRKIENGGDSVALGNRLMRGLGIDNPSNPPVLELGGWSTKGLEKRWILMVHKIQILLGI